MVPVAITEAPDHILFLSEEEKEENRYSETASRAKEGRKTALIGKRCCCLLPTSLPARLPACLPARVP